MIDETTLLMENQQGPPLSQLAMGLESGYIQHVTASSSSLERWRVIGPTYILHKGYQII